MTDLEPRGLRVLRPTTRPDLVSDPALAHAIRSLSDGNVVDIPPSGPTLARPGPRRSSRRRALIPALATRDRIVLAILTVGWTVSLAWFWVWLLQPAHRVSWVGLALNAAILFYLSFLPVYFITGVNRLRRVDPGTEVPPLRVAFVVTRAPSEPWPVARNTLVSMLRQHYPHDYDVWLCDEDPSDEIVSWCEQGGVHISTRRGVSAYHRSTWPRRTKCKEGNLAYFYDRFGYEHYDVVSQLDCDHVPAPTYLAEIVRPFADPAVGYVAAPSVNDANATVSWSVRGRLHREATLHGPSQLGHSGGLAPVCIGSHYAVRTTALREVGGVGPELAEDFSTSFLLNSAGWEGEFAIDAEAHGDGPATFSAMVVQEFQWSRSLTTVLLGLVPRHLPRMPWRLRLRFLFALTYYPLIALTTVCGIALAPVAAVTGQPWINVNYLAFLLHWWLMAAFLVAMALLLRRRRLLRPPTAPLISWENALYGLTRWPFNAWGVTAALIQRIRPRPMTFKVTPKGNGGLEMFPARFLSPFVALSLILSGAALYAESFTNAAGYTFLCLLGATSYAVASLAIPLLHARSIATTAAVAVGRAIRETARVPLAMALTTPLPALLALLRYPEYFMRVFG